MFIFVILIISSYNLTFILELGLLHISFGFQFHLIMFIKTYLFLLVYVNNFIVIYFIYRIDKIV